MFDCDQNIAFNCLDPSASCSDDNSDDSSPCDVNYISDGDCDFINNTDECGALHLSWLLVFCTVRL